MKSGYLFIALATLLFSSMEVALKFVTGQFNPIQMTFSRFLAGGIVLLPLALRMLKKRGVKPAVKDLGAFALLGFMGVAASMSLYQIAVTRIKASVVSVLFSSNPIFVTLFAFLILKEAISKHQVIGLLLDIVGIICIIDPFNLELDAVGVVCILGATLLFALYGVVGKKHSARFGGVVTTCFGFFFGAAELALLAALTHIPAVASALTGMGLDIFANIPFLSGYTLKSLPVVLYIFLCVTGGGFASYFTAMEKTSAQQTSLVFFFKPALAPILAFLILKESIPGNMILGIVLILCGSLISLLPGLMALRKSNAANK